MLLTELQSQRDAILALAEESGLRDVRVFGSVARGEEQADSDIDLLVNVADASDPLAFVDFQMEMEKRFGRKTDIVFERGLYHAIRDQVLNEAKPL